MDREDSPEFQGLPAFLEVKEDLDGKEMMVHLDNPVLQDSQVLVAR